MYYAQNYYQKAPTLGGVTDWLSSAGSWIVGTGSEALDIYGKAKQSEVYEKALTAVTGTKSIDYAKLALIGGGILLAILLVTKKA